MRRGFASAGLALLLGFAGSAAAETIDVTSARDEGRGTLRAAIEAANASPGSRILVHLGAHAEIVVATSLPAITAAGTSIEGRGVTLREGAGCRRAGGQRGCDGLVVRAEDVFIHGVRVAGFTFDGIGVRGPRARRVHLESIEAIDNLDDGIGVSEGARDVLVVRALLMGNGFRTKGKGLLVFDDSGATLQDSIVISNRDGITVSRGAAATLDHVLVAASYDKGVGISAGTLEGSNVDILASGAFPRTAEPAPNADGLRVGLDGQATLSHCLIAGSDDAGVVLLDRSTATLESCMLEANRGPATRIAAQARLTKR